MARPHRNSATQDIAWDAPTIGRDERWDHLHTQGATLWLTGLSGSGKSTLARALEMALVMEGRFAYRLDGDNIRHGLNADLGFGPSDRQENIRRIGEVASLMADAGALAVVSFISPYAADRARARAVHEAAGLPFYEVYMATSLQDCERRDPKGLYARARAGKITGFTGIDAPYEVPVAPELSLDTETLSLKQCVEACRGLLPLKESSS